MSAYGPSLRIEVKVEESCSYVKVVSFLNRSIEVTGFLHTDALSEMRKGLYIDLESFKDEISDTLQVKDWKAIHRAFSRLYKRGRLLAWLLFHKDCSKVQNLCEEAYKLWRQPTPFRLEVESTSKHSVPVEFLPLFNMVGPPEIYDTKTLAEAARPFLGFSAVVKRIIKNRPLPNNLILENVPKLPLRLFHHAGLKGARQEASFFRSNSNYLNFQGPWPDQPFSHNQEGIDGMAEHLWSGQSTCIDANDQCMDQIQHFACHCNTSDELSENHFLELSHDDGSYWKVTIGDLHSCFASLAITKARSSEILLPLVFLNACGSSVIDPRRLTSFPETLLINGNRGFIGTEASIPDDFAAAFSKQFYIGLLRGKRLGEAVLSAKLRILRRFNNPLGILYTMYASPDMRVRKKVNSFHF